ncbi:hypothetical protein BDQ17DRAFT_1334160 [Cyathus striatus]|nr:hypothetical protein BDQ17DRAFT_1334160 [Cyathus striatus]
MAIWAFPWPLVKWLLLASPTDRQEHAVTVDVPPSLQLQMDQTYTQEQIRAPPRGAQLQQNSLSLPFRAARVYCQGPPFIIIPPMYQASIYVIDFQRLSDSNDAEI